MVSMAKLTVNSSYTAPRAADFAPQEGDENESDAPGADERDSSVRRAGDDVCDHNTGDGEADAGAVANGNHGADDGGREAADRDGGGRGNGGNGNDGDDGDDGGDSGDSDDQDDEDGRAGSADKRATRALFKKKRAVSPGEADIHMLAPSQAPPPERISRSLGVNRTCERDLAYP